MKQNNNFFVEQSRNSEIKTQIVLTMFSLWLKNNKTKKDLSYIDLFSGPGLYDDGTLSTPVCILQEICATKAMAQKFNVVLNDHKAGIIAKLRRAIANIRNAKFLKTLATSVANTGEKPQVLNSEHCFMFLDPWGWKGMHRNYINTALQNKNCEMALMFSFNQFNRFMNFDKIKGIFDDLFDAKTLKEIRDFCANNPKANKENFVLNKFIKMITSTCDNCHCLPFKFKMENSLKTSHYVIFIIRDKKRFKVAQAKLEQFANYADDVLCYSPKHADKNMLLELSK
ncbi:MAG: three-Cys-motif partner protein TcmP [Alphaproteobacteria bacterium]|nr:three-Cys-motif partner protein TcmP [Alphaproteobacteria bacterium]